MVYVGGILDKLYSWHRRAKTPVLGMKRRQAPSKQENKNKTKAVNNCE